MDAELGAHMAVEQFGVAGGVARRAGEVDVELVGHLRVLVRGTGEQLGRAQLGVHQRVGGVLLSGVLEDLDEAVAGRAVEPRHDG